MFLLFALVFLTHISGICTNTMSLSVSSGDEIVCVASVRNTPFLLLKSGKVYFLNTQVDSLTNSDDHIMSIEYYRKIGSSVVDCESNGEYPVVLSSNSLKIYDSIWNVVKRVNLSHRYRILRSVSHNNVVLISPTYNEIMFLNLKNLRKKKWKFIGKPITLKSHKGNIYLLTTEHLYKWKFFSPDSLGLVFKMKVNNEKIFEFFKGIFYARDSSYWIFEYLASLVDVDSSEKVVFPVNQNEICIYEDTSLISVIKINPVYGTVFAVQFLNDTVILIGTQAVDGNKNGYGIVISYNTSSNGIVQVDTVGEFLEYLKTYSKDKVLFKQESNLVLAPVVNDSVMQENLFNLMVSYYPLKFVRFFDINNDGEKEVISVTKDIRPQHEYVNISVFNFNFLRKHFLSKLKLISRSLYLHPVEALYNIDLILPFARFTFTQNEIDELYKKRKKAIYLHNFYNIGQYFLIFFVLTFFVWLIVIRNGKFEKISCVFNRLFEERLSSVVMDCNNFMKLAYIKHHMNGIIKDGEGTVDVKTTWKYFLELRKVSLPTPIWLVRLFLLMSIFIKRKYFFNKSINIMFKYSSIRYNYIVHVIERVIKSFQNRYSNIITYNISGYNLSPLIPCCIENDDIHTYKDIVANLIQNAIDSVMERKKDMSFSSYVPQVNVFVRISACEESLTCRVITIEIEDNGKGLPFVVEDQDKALETIFTRKFSSKGKNRGEGLTIEKLNFIRANGDIKLESGKDGGVKFILTIKVNRLCYRNAKGEH